MTTNTTSTQTSLPTVTVDDLDQLAERVDRAIAEVQTLAPDVRAKAMTLKSTIEEFHKVGLTHIVKTLKNDPNGKQLLFDLVDQPAVYALFAMHGLVRADLRTQVSRVHRYGSPLHAVARRRRESCRCARQDRLRPPCRQLQRLFDVVGDSAEHGGRIPS